MRSVILQGGSSIGRRFSGNSCRSALSETLSPEDSAQSCGEAHGPTAHDAGTGGSKPASVKWEVVSDVVRLKSVCGHRLAPTSCFALVVLPLLFRVF